MDFVIIIGTITISAILFGIGYSVGRHTTEEEFMEIMTELKKEEE